LIEWLRFFIFTWLFLVAAGWAVARYFRWRRVAEEPSLLWLAATYLFQGGAFWLAMMIVGPHTRWDTSALRPYSSGLWLLAAVGYSVALAFEVRFLWKLRRSRLKSPPPDS
jgi:hypothetical protein